MAPRCQCELAEVVNRTEELGAVYHGVRLWGSPRLTSAGRTYVIVKRSMHAVQKGIGTHSKIHFSEPQGTCRELLMVPLNNVLLKMSWYNLQPRVSMRVISGAFPDAASNGEES